MDEKLELPVNPAFLYKYVSSLFQYSFNGSTSKDLDGLYDTRNSDRDLTLLVLPRSNLQDKSKYRVHPTVC